MHGLLWFHDDYHGLLPISPLVLISTGYYKTSQFQS